MKITLLTGQTFNLENEFDFPLKVNSAWKNKRLTLRIDTKKREVILSMPKFCSAKKAKEFISLHLDWIEKNLQKLPAVKYFEDGETISVCGKEIRLCHEPNSLSAAFEKDGILHVGGNKLFFHRRVKDYIYREAKVDFTRRSKIFSEKLGYQFKSITIKDTKSRWGSCSSLSNINYNWRIALAPEYVIDYLIAHEVSHLKHPNHASEFWQCVKALYPQSTNGRSWLKKNGANLYLYR